jgi:hypothetical protein
MKTLFHEASCSSQTIPSIKSTLTAAEIVYDLTGLLEADMLVSNALVVDKHRLVR